MVDRERLKKTIEESGLKKMVLAQKLGISLHALANKVNGKSEFKVTEVLMLESSLGLNNEETRAIFFNPCVELNSTSEVANG